MKEWEEKLLTAARRVCDHGWGDVSLSCSRDGQHILIRHSLSDQITVEEVVKEKA